MWTNTTNVFVSRFARGTYRKEQSVEQNQILKCYGTDYKKMTKELLAAADLIGQIPDRSCRIGIKPNLVAPGDASWGATTHPEIVAGIIEYLQEQDCRNLVIAEGSWVGDRTEEAFEVCGYRALSKQYGVPLLDAQKDTHFTEDCGGMELELCSCVKDLDFLINVPVLKGHCQTKITCALKNMKGLLPNTEKRHFHAMGLHRPIAHLAKGIRQDFIVVDHICGDLDFEDGGHPVVKNCIMAARDPVLVDAYVCGLLHYDVSDVPYIGLAEQLGAGSADLTQAEIGVLQPGRNPGSGVAAEAASPLELPYLTGSAIWDEELPYADKVVAVQDVVQEVESCSACYGYLIPALDRLREEGLLAGLKEKICIGQGYRKKHGALGVGSCTSGFDFCVKGCPPTETEIYEALKEYIKLLAGKKSAGETGNSDR